MKFVAKMTVEGDLTLAVSGVAVDGSYSPIESRMLSIAQEVLSRRTASPVEIPVWSITFDITPEEPTVQAALTEPLGTRIPKGEEEEYLARATNRLSSGEPRSQIADALRLKKDCAAFKRLWTKLTEREMEAAVAAPEEHESAGMGVVWMHSPEEP